MKRVKYRCKKAGMTVMEVLKENGISNKIIKSLKAKGHILKDEKIIYTTKELKLNDFITLVFDDQESTMDAVDMNIKVEYVDNDVMVIDKAYGVSSMSTMNLNENTLVNGIQYYLKENNINAKVHMVNRLDRNTTGLMVVALNRLSASALNDSLKDTLKRRYYAIVKGILEVKSGRIVNKIAKESNMTVRRCVRNDGKEAITNYKVIEEFNGYSLLDIELETGRTHQIRVTFADMGYPLVGDDFYNPDYIDGEELMLHSHYLEFIHPLTKNKITLEVGLDKRQSDFISKNLTKTSQK